MEKGPENLIDEQMNAEVEAELADALGDQTMDQLVEQAPPPPAPEEAPAQPEAADEEPVSVELKRGRIASVQNDEVFVELAGLDGKMQGIVPLVQFERPPRVGSIMDFAVDRVDESEGVVHLLREGAVGRVTWDNLRAGSAVEARVTGTNKGGLELELVGRIRAFMPASQIDIHHVDDMEQFVGQKLTAVVQELNRRGRKVLLSRRRFLEQDRERKSRKLWHELEVGQVREGTVSSIAQYGAFVDVGGADGLVHISDLSYGHITKPDQVVKVGDVVQVKVLKLDVEQKRISLGLKQVQPDPWDAVLASIQVGDRITGTVTRLATFGAFIEIEPGVEGLLPLSEMSWKRINRAEEVVQPNQQMELAIIRIQPEERRISLSLKQVGGDPWSGASDKMSAETQVEGKVVSITDFGAFVELETGMEGMVHISELSTQHVDKMEDVVKVGETHTFRVLNVDEDKHRIRLSLKPAGTGDTGGAGGSGPRKSSREHEGPTDGRLQRGDDGETIYRLDKSKATKRALKGGIE